jgi:hypothetical protein
MNKSKKPKVGCKRSWQDNNDSDESDSFSDATQAEEEE